MQILLYVLCLILWSCQIFADEVVLNNINLSFTDAFNTDISSDFKYETNKKELNMPRIRSQDSFGVCYGCAATTILQKHLCDYSPAYKSKNCNSLEPEDEISQFEMLSWALTNNKNDDLITSSVSKLATHHTNIRIENSDRRITSGFKLLENIAGSFNLKLNSEKCYNFQKLVNIYGSDKSGKVEELILKLKVIYDKKPKNVTEALGICTECISLNEDAKIPFSSNNTDFMNALDKKTFGEFFYSLIFKQECNNKITIPNDIKPKINTYPPAGIFPKSDDNKQLILDKIIDTVGNDKPVMIQKVCAATDKGKNITDGCYTHTTVISGYKNMCKDNSDLCTKTKAKTCCIPMVKIHNCYGSDWQNANKDGWVDARKLINHLNADEKHFQPNSITWYEPKDGTPKNPPPPIKK